MVTVDKKKNIIYVTTKKEFANYIRLRDVLHLHDSEVILINNKKVKESESSNLNLGGL